MEFTRNDLKNMKMIKEKLGTWSDTYDYLGIAPRTARYIRKKFKDNPELNIYNMKADNAELVEKRIDFLVDKKEEELKEVKPVRDLRRNQGTLDKYNINEMSGIPKLSYDDFAKYDEEKGTHVAGQFSNLPTGQPISKGKYRQIRGASLRQIRKMNKALHFQSQQNMDPVTAYERAVSWDKKYYQKKEELNNIAYKDKNGRWHWSENGKGKKGSFAKKEEVKEMLAKKGIDIDKKIRDQIGNYLDQVYDLRKSP